MPKSKKVNSQDLLDLITKQRISKKAVKFEGKFIEYLDLVLKDPSIVKTSHKRLYDALVDHGVEDMTDKDPRKSNIFDGDNIKIYKYFQSEFFGMERVIS